MASRVVGLTPDANPKFLAGLEPGELRCILGAAARLRFSPKTAVVHQGEPARRMLLLTDGGARFCHFSPKGHKLLGPQILPGDVVGGAALLLKPTIYLATTETTKESRFLAWDRTTIRTLLARYPKLMDNALCIAYDYMEWAFLTQMRLACDSARVRLAQTLVDLGRSAGDQSHRYVELHLTNEELANAAHVTVFTASRLLSEWHRGGALVKSRGKVQLRHPDRLFSRAV